MAQQGASLQTYNTELVKCIEELATRRDELQKLIQIDEEEKLRLQNDIRILTDRLAKVNESLAQKLSRRAEFDKTISETEAAYAKIIESSQTLLNFMKKEGQHLKEKTAPELS